MQLGDTEGLTLHPGVEEWLFWKSDQPMTWPTVAQMPFEVGYAFRYLAATYGKAGSTEAQSFHEKYAQQQREQAGVWG